MKYKFFNKIILTMALLTSSCTLVAMDWKREAPEESPKSTFQKAPAPTSVRERVATLENQTKRQQEKVSAISAKEKLQQQKTPIVVSPKSVPSNQTTLKPIFRQLPIPPSPALGKPLDLKPAAKPKTASQMKEELNNIDEQIAKLDESLKAHEQLEDLRKASDNFDANVPENLKDFLNSEIERADLGRNPNDVIKEIAAKFEGLDENGAKAIKDILSIKLDLAKKEKQVPKVTKEELTSQKNALLDKKSNNPLVVSEIQSAKQLKDSIKKLKKSLKTAAQNTIEEIKAKILIFENELKTRKNRVKNLKKVTQEEFATDLGKYVYQISESIKVHQDALDKAKMENKSTIIQAEETYLKDLADEKKSLEDKYGAPPTRFQSLKDAIATAKKNLK